MGVPVRLDLVTLLDEALDELREGFRDTALDEERCLDAELVKDVENTVDVPNHTLGDRRVVVNTRLVPVLDVDRERGGCPRLVALDCKLEHPWFVLEAALRSPSR
jgi:hypothetical protein